MDNDFESGRGSAWRGFARRAWKPLTASVVVGLVVAGLGYYSLSGERDGRRTAVDLRAISGGTDESRLLYALKETLELLKARLANWKLCGIPFGEWAAKQAALEKAIAMLNAGVSAADVEIYLEKASSRFALFLVFLSFSSLTGEAQAAQAAEIGVCKPAEITSDEGCKEAMSNYFAAKEELEKLRKRKELMKEKKTCSQETIDEMARKIKALEEKAEKFAQGLRLKCRPILGGDPYRIRLEVGSPSADEQKRMEDILKGYGDLSRKDAEEYGKRLCPGCKDTGAPEKGIPGESAPAVEGFGGLEGFEGSVGDGTPDEGTSEESSCSIPCDPPVSCTVDLSKVNQPDPPVVVYDYNYDGDVPADEAAAAAAAEKASCGSPSVCSTSLDKYCDSKDPVTGKPIDRGGVRVRLCLPPANGCRRITNPDGSPGVEGGTPATCGCTPNDVDYCLAALDIPPGSAGYDGPTAPPGGGGAPTGPAGYSPPATAPGAIPGGGGMMPPSGVEGME